MRQPHSLTDQNTISSKEGPAGTTNAGSIVALGLNDAMKILMEQNKNIAPTLTVKPGQEFIFLVAKDLTMYPYRP